MVSSLKRDCKYLNCNCNFCKHRNYIYIYIDLICENYIVYKSLWFIISRCLISNTCHYYFFFLETPFYYISLHNDYAGLQHKIPEYCIREPDALVRLNKILWVQLQIYFFSLGMFTVLALINDSICNHCREILEYINRWTYLQNDQRILWNSDITWSINFV